MSKTQREEDFLDLCKEQDDAAAVREALEAQPELVHCRDTRMFLEDETPLHPASRQGREQVVRVLLEHGAEVAAQGGDGATPLHEACHSGCEGVVRVLLEHGAAVNVQDRSGVTPLHDASGNGCGNVVRMLLEHGADRTAKNNKGETARDVAVRGDKDDAVVLLDTYFPLELQMVHVLLGLRGVNESSLTRFARHELFEPKVLSLVKCLLTGDEDKAFEQLQEEVGSWQG